MKLNVRPVKQTHCGRHLELRKRNRARVNECTFRFKKGRVGKVFDVLSSPVLQRSVRVIHWKFFVEKKNHISLMAQIWRKVHFLKFVILNVQGSYAS